MERFHKLIHEIMALWTGIFLFSIMVVTVYATQVLGLTLFNDTFFDPITARSLHITLMLYGPLMLALSLLPFALFHKDGLSLNEAVAPLKNYFLLWHLFLFMAVVFIGLRSQRGLAFDDFPYELNFVLASSGIFYIIAIFKTIKQYEIPPLWVKVSKALLFIAPVSLLILMNPTFGQVEKTITGPHGDNTLGMSFTLIPLFYLLIKIHAKEAFVPKWHIFWAVPLAAYTLSVGIRIFTGELSYNEEWVYHLNGFASDGIGAVLLFLFGPLLFGLLGFEYSSYYYLIFGFMGFVGIIHLIGVSQSSHLLAWLSSIARLITGTVFLALFYTGKIDALALLVGFYDIAYALLYLLSRKSA